MIRRILLATALLAFGGFAIAQETQDTDVTTIIADNAKLGTLARALEAADLVETLRGSGPFTVFAPSDAAFDALPEGILDELLAEGNRARLRAVLTEHVAPHRTLAARLRDGMMGDTLDGGRHRVSDDGARVTFGEATVTEADLEASNGVVHIVDTVLMPEDG